MKFYSILCLRIRPTSQTLSKDFRILSATASNSTNYNWQKIYSQTRWIEIHLEPGNLNKTKCLERIKEPIIYKVWEALITMYFFNIFFQCLFTTLDCHFSSSVWCRVRWYCSNLLHYCKIQCQWTYY